MHPPVDVYEIPGLAVVRIDSRKNNEPVLEICLDPAYPNNGDLRDIARTESGPDDVYLRCDSHGAINNPALLRFVEVLSQWDVTGDEVPDFAHVVDAIEQAMYLSEEAPHQFSRPNTGLARLTNRLLPPAPSFQIVLSFGDIKPRFRWYHHAAAIPLVVMVLGLIQVQNYLLPWLKYSVITGVGYLISHSGLSPETQIAATALLMIFIVNLLVGSRRRAKTKGSASSPFSVYTIGLLSKAAVSEEQTYREGSQDWSFVQRVRSCLAFGIVHMANLIYPLATILPLALGGAFFMAVYLRTYKKTHFRRAAVLEAAIWHRVYNRVALLVVLVAVASAFGAWMISAFGGVLVLGYFGHHVQVRRHRHHVDAQVNDMPVGVLD